MNLIKKLIATGLATTLILGVSLSASANVTDGAEPIIINTVDFMDNYVYTGLQQLEVTFVPESESNAITSCLSSVNEGIASISESETNWSQYGSRYFYNLLSADQKIIYDAYYNHMTDLLNGGTYASADYYPFNGLSQAVTSDEVSYVGFIVLAENPQFYFSENGFGYTGASPEDVKGLKPTLYEEYENTADRATATTAVFDITSGWLSTINSESDIIAKEKKAHDIIVDYTAYNLNADKNQSIVSLILEKETVCSGYARTFQLLCNAIGIDTIYATSSTHAWNLVELYGNWYIVDVTWNDTGNTSKYFNISDSTLSSYDTTSSHDYGDDMKDLYPSCILDTVIKDLTSITMSESNKTLTVGGEFTLSTVGDPSDVSYTDKWSSSNTAVATVSDAGLVTAVSAGTATITASVEANDSINATCEVTVENPAVTEITMSESSKTLTVDDTFTLTTTGTPSVSTYALTWSSSDTSVATVSNAGLVTAVSAGTATITAVADGNNGISTTCAITVENPAVTEITMSESSKTLTEEDTFTLTTTGTPSISTYTLTWSSSDTSVATVSDAGLVTAISEGTAVIMAVVDGAESISATCNITVVSADVAYIELNTTEKTLEETDEFQLEYTYGPSSADYSVLWNSSDVTVATVSNTGLVKAISEGTATITLKVDGDTSLTSTCTITVEKVSEPEIEDPEAEDPEAEDPEVEDPEVEDPEVEDPEIEDPEVEDPEKLVVAEFDSVYDATKGGTISIRVIADFADFIEVRVNGVVIDKSNYNLSEGSIIVELTEAYLATLANGDYTLEVVAQSGVGSAVFEVSGVSETTTAPEDELASGDEAEAEVEDEYEGVATGDATDIALYVSLLAISLVLMTTLLRKKYLEKDNI